MSYFLFCHRSPVLPKILDSTGFFWPSYYLRTVSSTLVMDKANSRTIAAQDVYPWGATNHELQPVAIVCKCLFLNFQETGIKPCKTRN